MGTRMKKLIGAILLAVVLGSLYIRYEVIQFGHKAYVFGCQDAALKLELSGNETEAYNIKRFCKARDRALNEYLGLF